MVTGTGEAMGVLQASVQEPHLRKSTGIGSGYRLDHSSHRVPSLAGLSQAVCVVLTRLACGTRLPGFKA